MAAKQRDARKKDEERRQTTNRSRESFEKFRKLR